MGYPRADRVREEPSAGTHAGGSTSRSEMFPLRPSASDLGVSPRSHVHPLVASAYCPGVQIHAPAELSVAWPVARGEYLQLRPETGFLCPPVRNVRAFA